VGVVIDACEKRNEESRRPSLCKVSIGDDALVRGH
jgi:hypothetical protein